MKRGLAVVLIFSMAIGCVSASYDQRVTARRAEDEWIYAFDYNATVGRYATGQNDWTIRIWDAATDEVLHTIQAPDLRPSGFGDVFTISQVAFSPAGDKLAASLFGEGGEILIIDTSTGQTLLKIGEIGLPAVHAIAWSPDGNRLAGVYEYNPLTEGWDGLLGLWDTETGEEVNQYIIGNAPLFMDWHPSDARLIFPSYSNGVVVWDAEQWQEVYTIPADENEVISVAWSPAGSSFATIGTENVIRLWNGDTGELLREFNAGDVANELPEVFWSQGGKWIGVTYGPQINVWDAETGVLAFSHEAEEQIQGIAMLADGRIVFALLNTVEKLDTGLVG